ncbi:MAG: calcium-binding protein, partial [Myxococcota bacterium]
MGATLMFAGPACELSDVGDDGIVSPEDDIPEYETPGDSDSLPVQTEVRTERELVEGWMNSEEARTWMRETGTDSDTMLALLASTDRGQRGVTARRAGTSHGARLQITDPAADMPSLHAEAVISVADAVGDIAAAVARAGFATLADVTGTDGNDLLIGTDIADTINGLGGRDTILGAGGPDAIDGGDGIDRASYDGGTMGVTVNLICGVGTGGDAEGDTLVNVENLRGSDFDDFLVGDSNRNSIIGGPGNDDIRGGENRDTLEGGAGADAFRGGGDFDYVSYANSPSGVVANLVTGGTGGDATGDTFNGVESLRGSNFNDTLVGTSGNNQFLGAGGNDNINGGAGDDFIIGGVGGDVLNGGNGIDWAIYSSSTAGVTVNLTSGAASGGEAAGDSLTSIENLRGSNFNDNLTGNSIPNVLIAAAGDDVMSGLGGDDSFIGGAGADTMNGGEDEDTVSYDGAPGAVSVNLATQTVSQAAGSNAGGDAVGDSISGMEGAVGTAFDDTLIGGPDENFLNGGVGGNDILDGAGEADTASFSLSSKNWTISLVAGSGVADDGETDTLISIENVV